MNALDIGAIFQGKRGIPRSTSTRHKDACRRASAPAHAFKISFLNRMSEGVECLLNRLLSEFQSFLTDWPLRCVCLHPPLHGLLSPRSTNWCEGLCSQGCQPLAVFHREGFFLPLHCPTPLFRSLWLGPHGDRYLLMESFMKSSGPLHSPKHFSMEYISLAGSIFWSLTRSLTLSFIVPPLVTFPAWLLIM